MRREDKRFWTDWKQAFPEFNLLLISSWMSFWFVSVVPKYLNYATFSSDSLVIILWFCPEFWLIICILPHNHSGRGGEEKNSQAPQRNEP
jgi:hypothetical protein